MTGTLYVVSTPIGNLEDITLRALRLLKEVALIAAEDTRHTRHLLTHFQITTPAIAYHEHNKLTRLDTILERLKSGDNVALVSDAGTPCISDPGWELVSACVAENIPIEVAPGAAAPLVALLLSGFPPKQFTFVGFPPRKTKELKQWFEDFRPELSRRPLICFEAPHRLLDTLEIALEVLGDTTVAVTRELTKLYQEVRREKLSEAIAHFKQTAPRGEFTLVFAPLDLPAETSDVMSSKIDPLTLLQELKDKGIRAKEAVDTVTKESGLSRRQVYDMWLNLK